jgi:hypothetical protein
MAENCWAGALRAGCCDLCIEQGFCTVMVVVTLVVSAHRLLLLPLLLPPAPPLPVLPLSPLAADATAMSRNL